MSIDKSKNAKYIKNRKSNKITRRIRHEHEQKNK